MTLLQPWRDSLPSSRHVGGREGGREGRREEGRKEEEVVEVKEEVKEKEIKEERKEGGHVIKRGGIEGRGGGGRGSR